MTEDWTPENLPIMLLNRTLVTSTRAKPIKIGVARVTASDEDSLLAFDAAFEDRANDEEDVDGGRQVPDVAMPSRYEAGADWLQDLTGLSYQISYYFPSSVRPNAAGLGKYGRDGMTYRILYEALCNAFNGGRRFIEDYFSSVFEYRMKSKYDAAIRDLKQRIADEAQTRRTAHKAYLRNYTEWAQPLTKDTFNMLARETKKDIVASLASGKIPLAKSQLSLRTLAARKRLGIASDAIFYATGNLIGSIVVSVILLDKATAVIEGEK